MKETNHPRGGATTSYSMPPFTISYQHCHLKYKLWPELGWMYTRITAIMQYLATGNCTVYSETENETEITVFLIVP
jgi:hypothetical protein